MKTPWLNPGASTLPVRLTGIRTEARLKDVQLLSDFGCQFVQSAAGEEVGVNLLVFGGMVSEILVLFEAPGHAATFRRRLVGHGFRKIGPVIPRALPNGFVQQGKLALFRVSVKIKATTGLVVHRSQALVVSPDLLHKEAGSQE